LTMEAAREFYGTVQFPVAYKALSYIVDPAGAVAICAIAALLPARRAMAFEPVEAIRDVF